MSKKSESTNKKQAAKAEGGAPTMPKKTFRPPVKTVESETQTVKVTTPVEECPTVTIAGVYFPGKPVVLYMEGDKPKLYYETREYEDGSIQKVLKPCYGYQLVLVYKGEKLVNTFDNAMVTYEDREYNPLRSFVFKALSQYNRAPHGTDEEYSQEDATADLKYLLHKPINVRVRIATKARKDGSTFEKLYFSPIYSKPDALAEADL